MRSLSRLVALAAVLCFPASLYAAPRGQKPAAAPQTPGVDLSQPLTLDRAIGIALQNQSTLGIAQAQLAAARARVTQSRSAYFPQITPSYSYSNQLTSQTFNGQRQTGTVTQSITQVGANLLLFDTGKREENVLVSRYSARAAELNVTDARQSVIQNVTTSYYDLLRTKELTRVSQASVDRAKATLDYTRAAAEAGALAQKDILQAQADYENAQVQLLGAQNNVRLAQTTLKNAMGILVALPITTPDTQLPAPPSQPDTRTAADYVKLAFQNRSDLQGQQASIDASRHNVRIADIQAGLQVDSSVTEGYRIDPDPGENRTFSAGFTYPLFDGGAARAAVRQAKANLEQSRRQLDLSRQQAQFDVEQAYLLREEARLSIGATQSAVDAARKNFDAALEARKEGASGGTVIDVITAQAQLVTAETNAVQATYDFYTNDARLQRAIGANDARGGGTKS